MNRNFTRNFTKNNNYKKPKGGSITDNIQDLDSVKEKLKGYKQVSNIDDVPIGTYIRYITLVNDNGQKVQKFRFGGELIKNAPEYIKLKSKDFHWSVQKIHYADSLKKKVLFKTIFFEKISQATIDRTVILQLKKEIESLQKENKLLRQKLGIQNHIRF